MGPAAPEFELTIAVSADDIDELGHVNNVRYLQWVQDAAVAHWTARAAPEHQEALRWIVLRHEIDYRRPARLGDAIRLHTWVGEAQGLRFDRHTEILRAADGVLLAKARTVWCPIDARTLRPAAVDPAVRAAWSAPAPQKCQDRDPVQS